MTPPCHGCKANCCIHVPMTKKEYRKLQNKSPRHLQSYKKFLIGGHVLILGKCPWLTKDFKCSVYEDRPLACQVTGTTEYPCEKMPGFEEKFKEAAERLLK
jgi:Fe-S-cluster containining protein